MVRLGLLVGVLLSFSSAGSVQAQSGAPFVDPSGVIYDSVDGELVTGVRVFLHYAPGDPACVTTDTAEPPSCLVSDDDLLEPQQQGQETRFGQYRFDVRSGSTYRLEVRDPTGRYVFPSERNAPAPRLDATGPIGVAGGPLPPERPTGAEVYHLEISLEGSNTEVFNNHIPLDPATLHGVQVRLDRRSTPVGGIVAVTVDIQNRSEEPILFDTVGESGGAELELILPHGFRVVSESVRIQRSPLETGPLNVAVQSTGSGVVVRAGSAEGADGVAEGQPFSLRIGESLRLDLFIVAGSESATGTSSRVTARWVGADGATLLGRGASGVLHVVEDALLDDAFILGRVFCDQDEDGLLGTEERGLPGAFIYLDAGQFAVSDAYGRFHFDEVEASEHLIKLDEASLPVGSLPTTAARRLVHITPGTPADIAFGVHCEDHVVREVEIIPVELQGDTYEVAGEVLTPTLTVDGVPVALPLCDLEVDSTDEGVNLNVVAPEDAAWVVGLLDQAGDAIATSEGVGPATLHWQEGGGAEGAVQAAVYVRHGDGECRSPTVHFFSEELEEVLSADLFAEGESRTTEDLRQALAILAPDLRSVGSHCEVRAHHDDSLSEEESLPLTQARAEAVAQLLVRDFGFASEFVVARGLGDTDPLFPNISSRNRRHNRRIEITCASSMAPLEPPAVVVGGIFVPISADGTFTGRGPMTGSHLQVEIRTSTGHQYRVRTLPPGVVEPAEVTDPEGRETAAALRVASFPLLTAEPERPPRFTVTNLGQVAQPVEELTDSEPETLSSPTIGASTVVEAGVLEVHVPPAGAVLERHMLMVWGTTAASNTISVNGEGVPVDTEGAFRQLVELPSGPSTLLLETLDRDGNRGRLEWPVEVSEGRYFLMAFGEGAVGSRYAELSGSNANNTLETESDVAHLLFGQTRLYFKGWISGRDLLGGTFGEIDVTAFIDTGRQSDYEPLINELIEPDRRYPIYGDASGPVQDVQARGQLYVMVRADESTVGYGSFHSQINGSLGLLQYRRTLEGGHLRIVETFAQTFETEVSAHYADDANALRRATEWYRGTGGTIYYLGHAEVVEGSELVELVTLDRDSGFELHRRGLERNADYTLRYGEGRLRFMTPIPSTVDGSFLTSDTTATRNQHAGHPVYVSVVYEYEDTAFMGGGAGALFARETYDEWLSFGGGYVTEGRRDGGSYRIWQVEGGLRYTDATRVTIEYARSENRDVAAVLSSDGGLTFDPMRLGESEGDGDGIIVRGGIEVADLLTGEQERVFYLGGYFRDVDAGFFSTGSFDQGQRGFGGEAHLVFSERHSVRAQYDGVVSTLDDVTSMSVGSLVELERQVIRARYLYDTTGVRLTLEYAHSYEQEPTESDGYHTDVGAVGIALDAFDLVTLGFSQEFIARSDDPRVIRRRPDGNELQAGDRFTTTASLGFQIFDELELRATERIRYSGDTATAVGFRSGLRDDLAIYVHDRLETYRDRHGTTNTVVIGSEGTTADGGRAYTEYQVRSGIDAPTNRAITGIGRSVALLPGFNLDLLYERTQITDAVLGGESIRDAGSLGVELLAWELMTLSTQFELRYDDGNAEAVRPSPCLVAGAVSQPRYCSDSLAFGTDRMQWSSFSGLTLAPTEGLILSVQYLHSETEDLTLQAEVARTRELGLGLAYRPTQSRLFEAIVQYTFLADQRPVDVAQGEVGLREENHVVSLVPIFNLDNLNLQLVERLVYRGVRVFSPGSAPTDNDVVLWINRLNYHLMDRVDAGVEYRLLQQSLTSDRRSGVLLEANYLLAEYVRLGLGYNFTSFSDDVFADLSRDASGVFFRVTGQY